MHPPESQCDGLVCAGGITGVRAEVPRAFSLRPRFPAPSATTTAQAWSPRSSCPQRCFDEFFCGHYKGKGRWYTGVVRSIFYSERTFNIGYRYDDGEKETRLEAASLVRLVSGGSGEKDGPQPGASCEAGSRLPGGGRLPRHGSLVPRPHR